MEPPWQHISQKGHTKESHQEGLIEEEVYGNVFVFSFAGPDVTAKSLTIGICLLAARPDIQDCIVEEINAVLDGVQSKDSSCDAVFSRLPRCLVVIVSDAPAPCGEAI